MSTLTIGFNQSLAKTLPRFFGGADAVWQELGQNAARAGAKNVYVGIFKNEALVTFRDDGSGITDWSSITTAGKSDWRGVVDPAGLGIFSYFSVSEMIVISSRGKRITLTTASLNGEPITIEDDDRYIDGTEVCLYQAHDIVSPEGTKFQHFTFHNFDTYVSMSVFSDTQVDRYTPPRFTYSSENVIHIPLVGDLVFDVAVPGESNTKLAVWAGQSLSEYGMPNIGYRLVWLIDPASGVLPKLPDRSSLIRDEAYKTAIERMTSTLRSMVRKSLKNNTPLPFDLDLRTVRELKMTVDVQSSVRSNRRSRPKIRIRDYAEASCLASLLPDLTFTYDPTLDEDDAVRPDIKTFEEVQCFLDPDDEDTYVVFCRRLYVAGRKVEAAWDGKDGVLYLSPFEQSPSSVTFKTDHLTTVCHLLSVGYQIYDLIDPHHLEFVHTRTYIDDEVTEKLETVIRRKTFPNAGDLEIAIDEYTKLIDSLEVALASPWWVDTYKETTESVQSVIERLSMVTESLRTNLIQA